MELEMNLVETGQHLLRQGGIFVWCIIAISIAAVVISLERFWMLKMKFSVNGRALFDSVKHRLLEGDIKGAEEACAQFEARPLSQLLRSGIAAAARRGQKAQLDAALESELLNFIPLISQRLNYLPSLANVATLFGLLGTITGLILAFKSAGGVNVGAMSQDQGLAAGIAMAMYATAFGLCVAIPTTLSYLYLSNAANNLMDDLDRYASAFKRLALELGFIEAREDSVSAFEEEAIADAAKRGAEFEKAKISDAHDRLERAQREVALERKAQRAEIKVEAKTPVANPVAPRLEHKPAVKAEVKVEKAAAPIKARVLDEPSLSFEVDDRVSATQAIRLSPEVVRPFSEETEKLFVSAVQDTPRPRTSQVVRKRNDAWMSQPTKINREALTEDVTDELTTPDLPGGRKP